MVGSEQGAAADKPPALRVPGAPDVPVPVDDEAGVVDGVVDGVNRTVEGILGSQ